MTHDEFIELQKKVYRAPVSDTTWENLFIAYNKKNKTNLDPKFRTGYIIILAAIALKHEWEFKAADLQQYAPYNKAM